MIVDDMASKSVLACFFHENVSEREHLSSEVTLTMKDYSLIAHLMYNVEIMFY